MRNQPSFVQEITDRELADVAGGYDDGSGWGGYDGGWTESQTSYGDGGFHTGASAAEQTTTSSSGALGGDGFGGAAESLGGGGGRSELGDSGSSHSSSRSSDSEQTSSHSSAGSDGFGGAGESWGGGGWGGGGESWGGGGESWGGGGWGGGSEGWGGGGWGGGSEGWGGDSVGGSGLGTTTASEQTSADTNPGAYGGGGDGSGGWGGGDTTGGNDGGDYPDESDRGLAADYKNDHPTTQEVTSVTQTFDDGSSLTTGPNGDVSSSPSPDRAADMMTPTMTPDDDARPQDADPQDDERMTSRPSEDPDDGYPDEANRGLAADHQNDHRSTPSVAPSSAPLGDGNITNGPVDTLTASEKGSVYTHETPRGTVSVLSGEYASNETSLGRVDSASGSVLSFHDKATNTTIGFGNVQGHASPFGGEVAVSVVEIKTEHPVGGGTVTGGVTFLEGKATAGLTNEGIVAGVGGAGLKVEGGYATSDPKSANDFAGKAGLTAAGLHAGAELALRDKDRDGTPELKVGVNIGFGLGVSLEVESEVAGALVSALGTAVKGIVTSPADYDTDILGNPAPRP